MLTRSILLQMTLMELLGMEQQHQQTRTDIDALRQETRAAQVAVDPPSGLQEC